MPKKRLVFTVLTLTILFGAGLIVFAFTYPKFLFKVSQTTVESSSVPSAVIPTVTNKPAKKYTAGKARNFFDKFIELEHTFDPAIFDLYAEDGVIKTTRLYPNGEVAEIQFTKDQLKELAPVALPLAKQYNDINTYSDIRYSVNEDSINITATRYNHYKKYTANYHMILKYIGDELKIKEEFSETIP